MWHFGINKSLLFWYRDYMILQYLLLFCALYHYFAFLMYWCIFYDLKYNCFKVACKAGGVLMQCEWFGRWTDRELGQVKKWFQGRGWWVKIGEGEGRKNMPARSHCSLGNAIHWIDGGSDWCGVGCQHLMN